MASCFYPMIFKLLNKLHGEAGSVDIDEVKRV